MACKKLSDVDAGMVICVEWGADDLQWHSWCHCHSISWI